jgi:hypothetical protein
VSKLVEVQFGELVIGGDSARLPLRWQATGPGGGRSRPWTPISGSPRRATTVLSLTGAYRPPLGKAGAAPDRAVLRPAATATIQDFVRRGADALVHAGQHS